MVPTVALSFVVAVLDFLFCRRSRRTRRRWRIVASGDLIFVIFSPLSLQRVMPWDAIAASRLAGDIHRYQKDFRGYAGCSLFAAGALQLAWLKRPAGPLA
jgi:hypothetical protein